MSVSRKPYPADGIAYADQGDTVDLICARYFGQTRGIVELLLDNNEGLAGLGPTLPMGTKVNLPSPNVLAPSKPKTINLWD